MAYYGGDRFPAWKGSLFVAALKEKSVRRVPMAGDVPGTQELLFTELGQRMSDVRAGPDGALYLLTDDKEGQVLRVVPREGGSLRPGYEQLSCRAVHVEEGAMFPTDLASTFHIAAP